MLSKFLKAFSGEEQAPRETRIEPSQAPPSPAINDLVPLLDKPPRTGARIGQAVDTDNSESVVTDVLSIETHGKRTLVSDLLQRFLGRQPIMDASGRVLGYELRIKKAAPPPGSTPETLRQMVDEMLLASLFDLDIHTLRGNKLIFVQLSPATLDTGFLERLPGDGIVLAINPAGSDPRTLTAHCTALKSLGYRIAVDEPELRPQWVPLLKMADFLRIDAQGRDAIQLGELVVAALKIGNATLIANRVDADEIYDVCRKLGFKAFQGYSFARLQPGQASRLDSQRLRVMELLNMAINKAEISEIEQALKRDPALSYRLLRYINSAANGLLQPVRSLNHALMVLGYDQLYRWLTLLLFASGEPDYRTLALMKNALVRARFAELLGGERLKQGNRDGLFIVGVFSMLDALLNVPMAQAISTLKLPPEMTQALLKREGVYAPYLELALASEEGEERILETYAAACGIDAKEINAAHAQALRWAEEVDSGE
jgi:EAL and modified HD-GYP domain-containing signal transduction protein